MDINSDNCAITFTFCDRGENHTGMQILGQDVKEGLNKEDLINAEKILNEYGFKTKLYDLRDLILEKPNNLIGKLDEAYVLIIEEFCNEKRRKSILKENLKYKWDDKYYCIRRKKVLNKHARFNVCYDEKSQEADYENKKGTIISYEDVPNIKKIKNALKVILGSKGQNLVCEGNLYYDINKTGIGWHGDAERKIVFGCRIGKTHPLCFKWWFQNRSFGKMLTLDLKDGDAYIMSEKAVGYDWKCSRIATIRHSAGCQKYIDLKK